jgi:2-keto-3-deoxy-L-rhamnonate aldolase RhmA/pimeloyl-ACP methyl ester carboxylesterase
VRSLHERLRGGESLVALLAKMPCAPQVESAGRAGFDLLILDTEHGPAGGFELEHHLRTADAAGLPALVRVPEPGAILAALDAGAAGIVVPHVLDAAGAEAVVAAAHYPPRGRRGFATSTRAGGYGAVPAGEHVRRAAAETCVVVQIEDAEAVPPAADILAVDGVSAVFIGAADLRVSLGHDPDAEIAAITAAARAAGVGVLRVGPGGDVVVHVATQLIHDAFVAVARRPLPASRREPLVLLPGMLGDAGLWEAVAPYLVEEASPQIARIDLDDSVPEMAESVLARAPERFALAGHSLGAIVALELVRRAPRRVTRLALLNASARPASDAQLAAWSELGDRTETGAFGAVARDFAHANAPADLVGQVERMAHAVGPRGFLRQLAAQRTRPDSRPSLGAIAVPTLVVSGANDTICPPALQEELVAGIPGARHVTVQGGHMVALEDPATLGRHLVAWLKTNEEK